MRNFVIRADNKGFEIVARIQAGLTAGFACGTIAAISSSTPRPGRDSSDTAGRRAKFHFARAPKRG